MAEYIERPGRGGRRAGAGRPSYGEELVRRTISLPETHLSFLEGVGEGNVSEGIRRLVEKGMLQGETWADRHAFASGVLYKHAAPDASQEQVEAEAETAAQAFVGEPAGNSSARYDAYEAWWAYKSWYLKGYQAYPAE